MSLFSSGPANISGYKMLNITELALPTSLASGQTKDSTTFNVSAGQGSLYVMATLASGQMQVKAKVSAVTPVDLTSGATDVTLVGAGSTNFIKLDSTSSLVYGAVRLVDSNWSSSLTSLDVMLLGSLPNSGFGWISTDAPFNNTTVVNSAVGQ